MDPADELAALNRRIEAFMVERPSIIEVGAVAARRAREEGNSVFGELVLSERAVESSVPGPEGDISVRMWTPARPRGVYLHLHGGGWVVGGSHHQDPRLERLSDRCDLAVVSVEYRLAPEHPYPAGPDDCEAVAVWLLDHAAAELGSERLFIGGESAGAQLAAVTLLRLRDRRGDTGFSGANLVYGAYDLRMTPSARLWGDRPLVLNTPVIRWFTEQFVPQDRVEDPDVSPLLADLSGMPPALFTVGTEDPLLDDTLFMYERWRAAGCSADLALYPGACHAFDAFEHLTATVALDRMHAFLLDLLDRD